MKAKSGHTFQILIEAIKLSVDEESIGTISDLITNGDIDWQKLYNESDFHCIRPQVYKYMKRFDPGIIPQEVITRLRTGVEDNLYRQMRNVAEFLSIKEELDRAGIMAVPFKGFWLAEKYYGSLAERESVDIDLYVRFKDLDRVMELMPSLGYGFETSASPAFIEKVKKESAELNFDKYEGDIRIYHVEFHWKMGSALHGLDISLDDLSEQFTTGKIQNHQVRVFNDSAGLLLTIMHHGGKDQFFQLKHVHDIGMILKNNDEIDWEWLLQTAERYRMAKLVFLAVYIASEMTGIEVPDKLKTISGTKTIKRLAENRIRTITNSSEKFGTRVFRINEMLFQLRARDGFGLRLRIFFEFFRTELVSLVTPRKLLKHYLRKRYRIVGNQSRRA